MRKAFSLFVTFLLIVTVISITDASSANATVGGPTYVGTFSYNPADESIYYVTQSYSGRGCPPELSKISLTTKVHSLVISCDQAESLIQSYGDYAEGINLLQEEFQIVTRDFKPLSPISLPKNKIEIDIEYFGDETSYDEFVTKRNFTANVHVNGQKTDEFTIGGCNIDQPFTFAGYAIPGFEKKIMILSSTRSDCWEGGYVGEGVHIVNVSKVMDRNSYSNQYKNYNDPLVPDETTLVVFEKDKVEVKPAPSQTPHAPTDSSQNNEEASATDTVPMGAVILIAALALGLGLLLGKLNLTK